MYLNWKDTVWVKLHCRNLLFFSWKQTTWEHNDAQVTLFFSLSRLGLFSIYYFNIHGLSLRRLLIGCKFQLSMEQEAAGACVRSLQFSFQSRGSTFHPLKSSSAKHCPLSAPLTRSPSQTMCSQARLCLFLPSCRWLFTLSLCPNFLLSLSSTRSMPNFNWICI